MKKRDGRSLKKKKKRSVIGRKEKRKKDRDRGEIQKEEKEKQMRKLGKKKKRREEEKRRGAKKKEGIRKTRNRYSSARDAPPSPGAFPSQKLGNNMTPTKGRLGKNTTPTCRGPEKLIQKLQSNPHEKLELRTSIPYELHSPAIKAKILKSTENKSNRTIIYKKAKAFGNLRNRSKFSINSH